MLIYTRDMPDDNPSSNIIDESFAVRRLYYACYPDYEKCSEIDERMVKCFHDQVAGCLNFYGRHGRKFLRTRKKWGHKRRKTSSIRFFIETLQSVMLTPGLYELSPIPHIQNFFSSQHLSFKSFLEFPPNFHSEKRRFWLIYKDPKWRPSPCWPLLPPSQPPTLRPRPLQLLTHSPTVSWWNIIRTGFLPDYTQDLESKSVMIPMLLTFLTESTQRWGFMLAGISTFPALACISGRSRVSVVSDLFNFFFPISEYDDDN